MKFTTVIQLFGVASSVLGHPEAATKEVPEGVWVKGGRNDFRGPCPMMNTLANHGFISRDGRNLTREVVVHGLTSALNFAPQVANIMWEQAVIANPEPNATFFTLDQLNVHGVLEHDASLSRLDAYFGNNHVFNPTVFRTTTQYWTAPILTSDMLANGKVYRQLASKASNPKYSFSATVENFSLGELAAPILMFGDIDKATVRRDLTVFLFENEKLPIELGWKKQAIPVSLEAVMRMSGIIANSSKLITGSAAPAPHKRGIDIHGSFWGSA